MGQTTEEANNGRESFLCDTETTPKTLSAGLQIHYYFICPPTIIAGDSTNILLNFTVHDDANAIDIYIYTLRRLLSVLYQSNVILFIVYLVDVTALLSVVPEASVGND